MKIPLYLFTLFFFWCCVSINDRQAMTDISGMREVVFDDKNTINIDSVIANYRFVRLDSTDNFPIGELWQTLITDDHIILVDKLHSKSVFIFDKTGKNKAIIHRQGRGPQEYISLFHVTLTPDRQKIAIVDDLGKKVVFFDLAGNFIESKKISTTFLTLEYASADKAVGATYRENPAEAVSPGSKHTDNLILFMDRNFNPESSAIQNRYLAISSTKPTLKKFGNDIQINPYFCDTIYQATPDGQLTGKYHLNMTSINGACNLPPDITQESLEKMYKTNSFFYGDYADGKDFALFNISTPPREIIAPYLYSKTTGKTYRLTLPPRNNEDFFTKIFLNGSCACYENLFMAVIPAYRIILGSSPAWKERHPEVMDGLTENSNPVLVFYELREPGNNKNNY